MCRSQGRFSGVRPGPWQALNGVGVGGYEIHHGQTLEHPAMAAKGDRLHTVLTAADGQALGWQSTAAGHGGRVLGVYVHGLLEDPAVLHALLGVPQAGLEPVFDGLAAVVQQHFDAQTLLRWVEH